MLRDKYIQPSIVKSFVPNVNAASLGAWRYWLLPTKYILLPLVTMNGVRDVLSVTPLVLPNVRLLIPASLVKAFCNDNNAE